MANRVRITGGDIDGDDNEGRDAQVDAWGNLRVREGIYDQDNKTYEITSLSGTSINTHDFNGDTGRTAVDGYIICDGTGNIKVDVSRDGLVYGDQFTIRAGENIGLAHLKIDSIRVRLTDTTSTSAYRIFLI